MQNNVIEFPGRQPLLNTRCNCPGCQEFYQERKQELSHEIARLAPFNNPWAEAQRSALIDELTRLQ